MKKPNDENAEKSQFQLLTDMCILYKEDPDLDPDLQKNGSRAFRKSGPYWEKITFLADLRMVISNVTMVFYIAA